MHRPDDAVAVGSLTGHPSPLLLLFDSAIAQLFDHHPILPPILPLRAQPSGAVAHVDPPSTGHYRCCTVTRTHISRNERGTRQLHHSHHHALTPTRARPSSPSPLVQGPEIASAAPVPTTPMPAAMASNAAPAAAARKPGQPEKKYKCQFCNRAFSRSEHRSRHERSRKSPPLVAMPVAMVLDGARCFGRGVAVY
jgi:hypothetical protein